MDAIEKINYKVIDITKVGLNVKIVASIILSPSLGIIRSTKLI